MYTVKSVVYGVYVKSILMGKIEGEMLRWEPPRKTVSCTMINLYLCLLSSSSFRKKVFKATDATKIGILLGGECKNDKR